MTGNHSDERRLYRSRKGEILGVCRGIAESRDFPVSTVRLIFVLLVLFGGMSLWVYIILAFVLPVEPE
jgi:phage shock protein PspC (stress-responsive transcriptional regulator)